VSKGRVLLIEDEPDVAEAIAWQLDKAGLEVAVASTGEQGLEQSRRGTDLVLLDLNLPGIDGLEVCRMIRRQTATNRVPIIIVSARGGGGPRAGPGDGGRRLRGEALQRQELVARCGPRCGVA
jgi:DNA-binding response OmpR family regulator